MATASQGTTRRLCPTKGPPGSPYGADTHGLRSFPCQELLEVSCQLASGLVPPVRVFLHGLVDDGGHVGRERRKHVPQGRRPFVEDLVDEGAAAFRAEGRRQGQKFIQGDAERVHVG